MKLRRVASHIIMGIAAAMIFVLPPTLGQFKSAAAAATSAAPYSGPVLSAAQKAQVKARQQKMTQDVGALQKDKKLTDVQKRAKFMQMDKAFQADMMSILTPGQRTELQQHRAAYQAKASAIRTLDQKLVASLTPDQKNKIQALTMSANAQAMKLRSDKSIPDAAKFAKFQEIQKTGRAQLLGIFTPAQRAQYDQLQAMEKAMAPMGTPPMAH